MICDHTALEKVNESNIFLIFGDFVLLSEARGPNLEPAVEHFFDFLRFCSTFEFARPEFGPTGRQKSDIPPFFVYRPSRFKEGYGQNSDF